MDTKTSTAFPHSFTALTSYSDYQGTASADTQDKCHLEKWLEKNNLKKPEEFLAGITLCAENTHGKHEDPILVTFLFSSPDDYEKVKSKIESTPTLIPIPLRSETREMSIAEFFSLFKRINIKFSPNNILNGRRYTDTQ